MAVNDANRLAPTSDEPQRVRRGAAIELEADVLGALEHAIAVLTPDWRVLDINVAWERVLGAAVSSCAGRELWACFPVFAQPPACDILRATRADSITRRFELFTQANGGGTYGARVARTANGLLVIELALPYATRATSDDAALEERISENVALRVLAKQMAEVADSAQLLEILCDAASAQCSATGALVIQTSTTDGEVIAATGTMMPARGRRFPLSKSLASEAIETRSTVAVDDFSRSQRPLARVLPEVGVGPMLLAPLVAHDNVLGVIGVVREPDSLGFAAHEARRLHIIADHAALALWKAELLEQAQAADHAKGRFLATISHELRTPLTALTGYEELLADQVIGPLQEAQLEVLDRMRSVTHHLTVMIEEVLAFSSLEAGRESVRPTEFLAADLLRSATVMIEPLARQKQLNIELDVPQEPIRLTSDIDKLRQILVNLAGNAVKFTDEGGVRLTVCRKDHEVRFAIRDTGIGIAMSDVRRLFRPFTQLDTGLTRRYGGTGLGLYISQRLARLVGGRIEVQSQPGRGSTFTLVLPVE